MDCGGRAPEGPLQTPGLIDEDSARDTGGIGEIGTLIPLEVDLSGLIWTGTLVSLAMAFDELGIGTFFLTYFVGPPITATGT